MPDDETRKIVRQRYVLRLTVRPFHPLRLLVGLAVPSRGVPIRLPYVPGTYLLWCVFRTSDHPYPPICGTDEKVWHTSVPRC